ncbi:12246_t:CDS:2 [Ambispora gerdemannii]|uniref:12246_t:CDS:1 n=1 Tax=Ambispora gerdemannii TaxID=144530 RepID=A0A9N9G8V9_9GLOM|nr:12246_t:CDS:2 [Ambispora gerdemannii]
MTNTTQKHQHHNHQQENPWAWADTWAKCIAARIQSEIIDKKISIPPLSLPLNKILAPTKNPNLQKPIKTPQNAYILYRKEAQNIIQRTNPKVDFIDISRFAGERWRNETKEVRYFFSVLAGVSELVHDDMVRASGNKAAVLRNGISIEEQLWRRPTSLPQFFMPDDKSKNHGGYSPMGGFSVFKLNEEIVSPTSPTMSNQHYESLPSPISPLSPQQIPSPNSAFKLIKTSQRTIKNLLNKQSFHPYSNKKRIPIRVYY